MYIYMSYIYHIYHIYTHILYAYYIYMHFRKDYVMFYCRHYGRIKIKFSHCKQ